MATFEHDGETLWFEEHGSGQGDVFIALHGGLGLDHTCLRPWLDPLAEDLRLVYPDVRANGRSTGDGEGMTMQQLADDVDVLRDHLDCDRIWLFGHSYGGFIALQYALSHRRHLHGVILCDTDCAPPRDEIIGRGLERLGADPGAMAAFANPIETTEDLLSAFDLAGPLYLPHSDPATGRAMLADTIYRSSGSSGGNRALADWDLTGDLGRIDAPTLVLTGEDDFMFPPERAEVIHAGIPGSRIRIVPGSGHLPFIEQPDQFIEAVRSFVGSPAARA